MKAGVLAVATGRGTKEEPAPLGKSKVTTGGGVVVVVPLVVPDVVPLDPVVVLLPVDPVVVPPVVVEPVVVPLVSAVVPDVVPLVVVPPVVPDVVLPVVPVVVPLLVPPVAAMVMGEEPPPPPQPPSVSNAADSIKPEIFTDRIARPAGTLERRYASVLPQPPTERW